MLDISTRQEALEALCVRFGVESLYIFGSAVRDALTEESDFDFLVEFDNPVIPGISTATSACWKALRSCSAGPLTSL
jgi:predicted nucleotidyltransferase